jgi:hypothetical protein
VGGNRTHDQLVTRFFLFPESVDYIITPIATRLYIQTRIWVRSASRPGKTGIVLPEGIVSEPAFLPPPRTETLMSKRGLAADCRIFLPEGLGKCRFPAIHSVFIQTLLLGAAIIYVTANCSTAELPPNIHRKNRENYITAQKKYQVWVKNSMGFWCANQEIAL